MKGALYEAVKTRRRGIDFRIVRSQHDGGGFAWRCEFDEPDPELAPTRSGRTSTSGQDVREIWPRISEAGRSDGEPSGNSKSIKEESARIAGRAKNDFKIAESVENNARAEFNDEKQQANALNSKAIEYEMARQEAQQSRTLYQNLLGKLKEADVLAGLRSSNITHGRSCAADVTAGKTECFVVPGRVALRQDCS